MAEDLAQLYDRLRRTPIAELSMRVGDFMLYDSLIAGWLQRASRGERIVSSQLPSPDPESAMQIRTLRAKTTLTDDERAFLGYASLLEQILAAIRTR